jgi:hypothetical protein
MARKVRMTERIRAGLVGLQTCDTWRLARIIGLGENDLAGWDSMQDALELMRGRGEVRFIDDREEHLEVRNLGEVWA